MLIGQSQNRRFQPVGKTQKTESIKARKGISYQEKRKKAMFILTTLSKPHRPNHFRNLYEVKNHKISFSFLRDFFR